MIADNRSRGYDTKGQWTAPLFRARLPDMVMIALRLSLAAAALSACGPPAATWEKPGASESAMLDDLQNCWARARLAVQARTSPASGDYLEERDAEDVQRVRRCMRDKGYELKPSL